MKALHSSIYWTVSETPERRSAREGWQLVGNVKYELYVRLRESRFMSTENA